MTEKIYYEKPREEDGAKIWFLIRDSGSLDLNSAYCYLMLCKYFSDTCIVARCNDKIIGFVSSYFIPQESNVLFIWQVAVAGSHRGKGIGKALLKKLLDREECSGASFIKTTVTPSNIASGAMFRSLAADLGAGVEVSDCFSGEMFPESGHEEEQLFIIGPFKKS